MAGFVSKLFGLALLGLLAVACDGAKQTGVDNAALTDGTREATGSNNSTIPAVLSCRISSRRAEYKVGEKPEFDIRIRNEGAESVQLVGSLYASESRARYPYCYFESYGPDGNAICGRPAYCGNLDMLRLQQFVEVAPGAEFDPSVDVSGSRFFPNRCLDEELSTPGEYRFRFHYSTDNADPLAWIGGGPGGNSRQEFGMLERAEGKGILELLKKVPKETVASNEIVIRVVP